MKSEPASPRKILRRIEVVRQKAERRAGERDDDQRDDRDSRARPRSRTRNRHEIGVKPESSPSSPSMKLIAFIMPTYQNSVSGTDSHERKVDPVGCGL